MADQKISELTAATSLASDDMLVLETAAGSSKKIAGANLSTVQTTTVHFSSADILSLFATPKQVIAAPGSGKILFPTDALFVYNFVSADYSYDGGNANAQFTWVLGNSRAPFSSGHWPNLNLSAGSSQATYLSFVVDFAIGWTSQSLADMTNQPLKVKASNQNPTGGDGTFDLTIHYSTVTL